MSRTNGKEGRRADMTKKQRWIKSIIETAARETTALPWQRGSRRALSITRRQLKSIRAKSA